MKSESRGRSAGLAALACSLPLALLLALPAWSQVARGSAPPDVEIVAPPKLEGEVVEVKGFDRDRLGVAQELAGLEEAGGPIRVVLAPEDSEEARRVASWVAGYAPGDGRTVVLFPARSPTYPDRSLEALFHHEVAHVFIQRAAGGYPVPRWFHEGVATAAARAWNLEDTTRFALERLRGDPVPLDELDEWFHGEPSRVHRAYAVSSAFVRELLAEHGRGVTGRILDGVSEGWPFEDAFFRATGLPLSAAEARFRQRFRGWQRWLPFVTSSVALWILVTGLALVAIWRRKRRDAEMYEQWEEQEAWDAAAARPATRRLDRPSRWDRGGDGSYGDGEGGGWVH